jgi:hypothetical protein
VARLGEEDAAAAALRELAGGRAALEAFEDLAAPDALELLGEAPDPARAARLTRAQVSAALKRARRRAIADKTTQVIAALRSQQLGQPTALTAAYAVTVRAWRR